MLTEERHRANFGDQKRVSCVEFSQKIPTLQLQEISRTHCTQPSTILISPPQSSVTCEMFVSKILLFDKKWIDGSSVLSCIENEHNCRIWDMLFLNIALVHVAPV